MENRLIVFEGKTKQGRQIIIRYPHESDLMEMTQYINTLSKEQTCIRFQGEQMTIEGEERFLDQVLKDVEAHKVVYLAVFYQNALIGTSTIRMGENIEKHIGSFGISIAQGFREEGIGTLLMECVLNEAKQKLTNLRICTLSVFATNERAKHLYEKFGFKEYGTLPKGIQYKGDYIDHVYMFKTIK